MRKKQLLVFDLIGANQRLAFRAYQPVDELLSLGSFDMRMFVRIDENNTVLVEQLGITFDQYLKIAFILKANPRATVSQGIGVHANGDI